jgi:hypothetical protein
MYRLLLMNFFLRYLLENCSKILVTFAMEIRTFIDNQNQGGQVKRDLVEADRTSLIFYLVLGTLMLAMIISFWACVLPCLLIRFKSLTPTSLFSTLKEGLNKNRCTNTFYYIHFTSSRFLIAVLIGFSRDVDSLILWSIFVVYQAIFVFFHVLKIYENWFQ